MTIRELFEKARLTLRDEKRAEYSDAELRSYLSDSIEYLSAILASFFSSYTRKNVWATASIIDIPVDFLTADTLGKDTKVFSDYIEFEKIPVNFTYYARYKTPKQMDENIAIPPEFFPAIAQNIINRALSRNEYSTQTEQRDNSQFYAAVMEIAKRREGLVRTAERKLKYEV